MTTKRRPITRERHNRAEVQAWEAYMMWGRDYFGDLWRAGLSNEDIEREAPDVWRRHADRFMQIWNSDERWGSGLPYGAKRFGN